FQDVQGHPVQRTRLTCGHLSQTSVRFHGVNYHRRTVASATISGLRECSLLRVRPLFRAACLCCKTRQRSEAIVAGYSGTPLAKKLGIKDGSVVVPIDAPSHYRKLLEPLPADVKLASRLTAATDIVHYFSAQKAALAVALRNFRDQLKPNGTV